MRIDLSFFRSGFFWATLTLLLISLMLLADNYVAAIPSAGSAINHFLDDTLGEALREKLGDALLIAVVLATIVDRYLKLNLLKEVQRDALSFAAGHTLPDPIKNRITELIRAPYARKNFEMTLALTSTDTAQVKLTMRTSYDVVNLTPRRQHYEVRSAIEKGQGRVTHNATLEDVRLGGSTNFHVSGDQLRPGHRRVSDEGSYVRFTRGVKLEPVNGTPLHVETTRSIICPESWFYVLDNLELTLGIKIAVERVDEFNWGVHFGAQGEIQKGETYWNNSGVHLPGQFVRIDWTKI
jgi:hypothetical protein